MDEDDFPNQKLNTNVIYPDAFKRPLDNELIDPIERINFFVTIDEIKILTTYRKASPEGKDLLHTIVNTIAQRDGNEKPFA